MWVQCGLPLGTGASSRSVSFWRCKKILIFCFHPGAFTDLHHCCRGRSPKSSLFHPLEHHDHDLHLLSGVLLWCLSSAHPHGALLPDSPCEPLAAGFFPCWVGPCQICCGCWHPLCSFIQVTAKLRSILAPSIERQEGKARRLGNSVHVLTCVSIFSSSLVGVLFPMPHVIYSMADDGLLFRDLPKSTPTPVPLSKPPWFLEFLQVNK